MTDFTPILRAFRKNPNVPLLIVAVLAIGAAANIALFSIVDRALLHPVAFRDPDRIVEVEAFNRQNEPISFRHADFAVWPARIPAFSQTSSSIGTKLTLTGVPNPEDFFALEVSRDTFPLLGVSPEAGRWFRPEEFRSDAAPVVLLSDRLWRRQFHGDRSVLGRQILLDGQGYTIVGVMGPDFVYHSSFSQAWIPLRDTHETGNVIARLRPGVTIEQAQRQLDDALRALPPSSETPEGFHARLAPYTERLTREYRRALLVLWGAAGLILLIACANAANLLLERAAARRHEFAIRAALGAGLWRLVRQIFLECLMLGTAAGALGVALAWVLLRVFSKTLAAQLQLTPGGIGIHAPALIAAVALVLLTSILCALPPAFHLLRATPRRAPPGRGVLIAVEVALSMVLLTGAGLLLTSLSRLLDIHLGFAPDHVLTAHVGVPPSLKDKDKQAQYYSRLLDEVSSVPAVTHAGIVTFLPLGGIAASTTFTADGADATPHGGRFSLAPRSVRPDYFAAIGIRLAAGRAFTEHDTQGVAIVNQALARHYWPGENPIGKHVTRDDGPHPSKWLTIVGVTSDVRYNTLQSEPAGELFLPYREDLWGAPYTSLVVRAQGDPLSLAPGIRARIRALNPDQPVTEVKTMTEWVSQASSQPRFHATLLALFAAIAALLSLRAVFDAVTYQVTRRTREIGIRGALGATRADILAFVLKLGMKPVALGAFFGIAGALAVTRVLESELYRTSPFDPVVLGAMLIAQLAAAALAAFAPAWRAAAIDPAVTLRAE